MNDNQASDESQEKWEQFYKGLNPTEDRIDNWLDKHAAYLESSAGMPILDLGCGAGNNTRYVVDRGFQVVACDFSERALELVRTRVPEAQTLRLDLREPLPFPDHSAAVLIADLSLHYFSWLKTLSITLELNRVLKPDGVVLARVNSVHDIHYGAGAGELVERNLYRYPDRTQKRFFDRADLERLWSSRKGWRLEYAEEHMLGRYGKPKSLWETASVKKSR